MKIRLQRFLAQAGVASRRQSEQLIAAGRVEVNGIPVRELGTKIDPAQDRISFNGAPVKPKKILHIALHKPRGYLCTRVDPEGRKTVGQLLPQEWGNLQPVGRLDCESDGLLFLTNDGDLAFRLTHPRYGVRKKYLMAVAGKVDPKMLGRLTRGIEDKGEILKAVKARLLKANASQSVLEVELEEGKNRELRRMMEALGRPVISLKRIQIGQIRLGELPVGKWRILQPPEIATLLKDKTRPATEGRRPRGAKGF